MAEPLRVDEYDEDGETFAALEEDQLVAARQHRLGRRQHLSTGARLSMWGLRIYALLMFVVVAYDVVRVVQGPAG